MNVNVLNVLPLHINCYPEREGNVMPILFWNYKALVAKINRGNTVIEDRRISFNGTCKPLHRQP